MFYECNVEPGGLKSLENFFCDLVVFPIQNATAKQYEEEILNLMISKKLSKTTTYEL